VIAIRAVLKGEVYVDPTALKPVVEGYLRWSKTRESPTKCELSKRQQQIVRLIVEGHRNLEIAKELGISLKTVEKHRSNLMKKLDVHSLADLITTAVSEGISMLPKRRTPPSA
jgi:DNA-binding NarL/FixJ family response regulator